MAAPLLGRLFSLFGRSSASLLFRAHEVLGRLDRLGGQDAVDQLQEAIRRKRYARKLAERFVVMVRSALRGNVYGYPEKSPFTKLVQGNTGRAPLHNTGSLMRHLQIEERLEGYSVGWDNRVLEGSRGVASGRRRRRMKAYQLVQMLEKGAVIPADPATPKGQAVRRFFAAYGVFLRDRTKSLVIPPRPFYTQTIARFKSMYSGANGVKIIQSGYRLFIKVETPSGAGFRGGRR